MAKGDILTSLTAPDTGIAGATILNGALWVVSANQDKIWNIDKTDGSVISSFSAGSTRPSGLTNDGTYLYVIDDTSEEVKKFSTAGVLQDTISFSVADTGSIGLAFDGDNFWLVRASSVRKFATTGGSVIESFALDVEPGSLFGITWDGQKLVVNDNGILVRVARDGTIDEQITTPVSVGAGGLAWDSTSNTVWVGGSPIVEIEVNFPIGPSTNEELFQASYADASAADPKVTALIRPADVQRSIDTDVFNLKDGPNLYTVEVIFDVGELSNLNPYNSSTEAPRVFFVKDDQPGLRSGKNLLLKGYTIRDANPSVPVTCTFWG